MSDMLRESPLGQIIRYATGNKLLKYPEEIPGFDCPNCYANADAKAASSAPAPTVEDSDLEKAGVSSGDALNDTPSTEGEDQPAKLATVRSVGGGGIERVGTRTALAKSNTRAELEQQFTQATLAKGPTQPIEPEKLQDGTILVDWYTTDDPANPQNWSLGKRLFVTLLISLYTVGVYMGSAIYAPSIPGVMLEFGVDVQTASLGLSMYVLAYGLGPMLWSPLSEIPAIGRNPPYMATFAIFVILIVPTALADNFAGLVILRFILGFFGSPCLATGGASLQDMFSLIKLPYVLSLWALSATCGPALGPIISGFSVTAEGWRWSQWEMLWLSGPIWLVMFFALPETSGPNILLRRAKRLRAITGNQNLRSQSELDSANMSVSSVVLENLYRPMQMMLLDPAVAFTAGYTMLLYGIYYSFFECFPLVYGEMYHFNMGVQGLAFLSITVGVIISLITYWAYIYYVSEPEIRAHGLGAPERRLIPAMFATWLAPIGLFIFAWTADEDIHWIVSVIGITIFTVGIFIVMQCIFMYLPLTYPMYAASLFAGNDLTRSALAAGAIHFSRPMFANIGVGSGVSILAAFTALCCFGIFALYYYGATLRARSKFAAK